MSRGVQAFKQTDVTKAVRGAIKAGLLVQRFEIERGGKIVIIAGQAAEELGAAVRNEWDDVK